MLIAIILLGGIGLLAAGWWYNAPLRFAGVKRSAGTAAAAPFEPPADEGSPTRAEIHRLLRRRDFPTLTRLVDAKQALVERDIRNESELHRVIDSFYMQKQKAAAAADSTGGHYSRGHQHLRAGDQRAALAEFETAVRRNPAHFDAYLSIDQILASRAEWDAVIGHWTTYLAGQPNDGRAYLERAGANRRKGDIKAAQADILKGCQLGTAQACAIAKSQGWQ